MHPTTSVSLTKVLAPAQLSMFGDVDNVTTATQQCSLTISDDTQAKPRALRRSDMKVSAGKSTSRADSKPHQTDRATELLLDPDEPDFPDLEAIEKGDSPAQILAKRMLLRMMWDLQGKSEVGEPDLFGQTSLTIKRDKQTEQNRLDALIWLYGLNPAGSRVSIEMVCDMLGLDHHRIRRIVGRSMRDELKRIVNLLSTMVSCQHAQLCEEKLSDYLDVTNWKLN